MTNTARNDRERIDFSSKIRPDVKSAGQITPTSTICLTKIRHFLYFLRFFCARAGVGGFGILLIHRHEGFVYSAIFVYPANLVCLLGFVENRLFHSRPLANPTCLCPHSPVTSFQNRLRWQQQWYHNDKLSLEIMPLMLCGLFVALFVSTWRMCPNKSQRPTSAIEEWA